MTAIILAGGFGTRLQSVVSDIPKPMAPVNGKPFLEYLLESLLVNGVTDVILSVGYKWEAIRAYFGDKYKSASISYIVEETPLGTGGAIRLALEECSVGNVLALNGDTFFDVSAAGLLDFHSRNGADITLSLREINEADRYGVVELLDGKVIAMREKSYTQKGLINGGVYCIRRDVFDSAGLPECFSFESFLSDSVDRFNIFGLPVDGNFIDIGIPEDYNAAQDLLPEWVKL